MSLRTRISEDPHPESCIPLSGNDPNDSRHRMAGCSPARPRGAAAAAAAARMSDDRAEKVQQIVSLTSLKPADAEILLEAHGWDVGTIESLLHVQDPDSRKRKAPTSFDPTPQASSRTKPKKKSKTKAKAAATAKPNAKAKPESKSKPKAAVANNSEKKPSTPAASASAGASSSTPMDSDGDASSRDLDEKSSAAGEVPRALTPPLIRSRQSPDCICLAQLKVPLARVRRTIVDGSVKQVKPEALVLIAKAAEMFVEHLVEEAYSYTLGAAQRRGGEEQPTSYVDLANAVGADSRLAFLADIIPPKRKVMPAPKQESAQGAELAAAPVQGA